MGAGVRLKRVIARLDVKGDKLIKGVHLEGLRVLGPVQEYAEYYYQNGIDELVYIDLVATLYGRSKLTSIVERASKNIFVPLTVGGGVRTVTDVRDLLLAGADKVAINTAAVKDPAVLGEASAIFGRQCLVAYVEAKRIGDKYFVFTDNARENSGIRVEDWLVTLSSQGIGEVLLTSIDHEGTRKGFDIELLRLANRVLDVPVIVSGGFGQCEDLKELSNCEFSAVAIADGFHYRQTSISEVKEALVNLKYDVRV